MNETELVDVGDKSVVKKELKKHKLKRLREIEDLKAILSTPGGRYLLWRFFSYCKIFDADAPMDINYLAMKAGIRNAGLWMLNEALEANPNVLAIMKQEAVEREK